jgi:hypothetical protein
VPWFDVRLRRRTWVKLRQTWPDQNHSTSKNTKYTGGAMKVPRVTKIYVVWQLGWICFQYRQRNGALLVAVVRKGTQTVVLFVNYFYSEILFIKLTDNGADRSRQLMCKPIKNIIFHVK